jgi:hypothetical protein
VSAVTVTMTSVSKESVSSHFRAFAPAGPSAWNALSFGCTCFKCQLPDPPTLYNFLSQCPLYLAICVSTVLTPFLSL